MLGWHLVAPGLRARIVEVEAYRTPDDPACHAHRGQTTRNQPMFGLPGTAYVYFSYGNHWMLNVVGHSIGVGAAVLIRAAEPLIGTELMLARRGTADLLSGPGKLCQAFAIDGQLNGADLLGTGPVRLDAGGPVERVAVGPRVGISLGKENLWRFADADSMRWVSKPHQSLAVP